MGLSTGRRLGSLGPPGAELDEKRLAQDLGPEASSGSGAATGSLGLGEGSGLAGGAGGLVSGERLTGFSGLGGCGSCGVQLSGRGCATRFMAFSILSDLGGCGV